MSSKDFAISPLPEHSDPSELSLQHKEKQSYTGPALEAVAAIYVRVSYSGLSTLYSFERILNDIPFVNSFPLFTPTLILEL